MACRVSVALNGASIGSIDLADALAEHSLLGPPLVVLDPAKPVDVRFTAAGSFQRPARTAFPRVVVELGGLTLVSACVNPD